jgi:hypothetical protein
VCVRERVRVRDNQVRVFLFIRPQTTRQTYDVVFYYVVITLFTKNEKGIDPINKILSFFKEQVRLKFLDVALLNLRFNYAIVMTK